MTDIGWLEANLQSFETLKCPRSIGSCPKTDMRTLKENSPSPSSSLLSLQFILANSNYCQCEWDNPSNPTLGNDAIKPTYNIALQIIEALSHKNQLWAAAIPETRSSETWKTYKPLPTDEGVETLAVDLRPKLVSPSQIKLLLGRKTKTITPIQEFQATLLAYEDIGLNILGRNYHLKEIPFICPVIGEDEIYGLVNFEGPLLIANHSFLKILETNSNLAQEIYEKAISPLFLYRQQSYEQDEYGRDEFRRDYPACIHLLANPGLVVKNKIKAIEANINESIIGLIKSSLPQLATKISETCEKTKGLKINHFNWDPKKGITLSCFLSTETQENNIKINEGKIQVYTSDKPKNKTK